MLGYLSFCLLACWMTSIAHAASSLLVESPAGKIQGIEVTANNKQTYVAFRGIPYAKPPLGELRFSKPEPHPKFEETFDGTGPIVECPQPEIFLLPDLEPGEEDCLVLNVYTKNLKTSQDRNRKVLVFIHGGGFILGSSKEYNAGTFVTEQDIIVVTVNYRLGALGFLSTENEASPGNYGMWDQTLALKWVKDNIASFGGDPDDITISGESAGGASVAILSITPFTKGLFSKAYPMSGAATSLFANSYDPQLATLKLAQFVNCWDGDTDTKVGLPESKKIMTCLRERPFSNFTKYPVMNLENPQFVPSVDGEFIPDVPSKLLKDDRYLESVGFYQRWYLFGIDNNEQSVVSASGDLGDMALMNADDKSDEEKAAIKAEFLFKMEKSIVKSRLGIDDPSESLVNKIMDWYERRFVNASVADLITDLAFLIPVYDFVDALARGNSDRVYLFYFNYYPSFMKGGHRGMPHGGDLVFWFDIQPEDIDKILRVGIKGDLDQDDLELKVIFSSLIADFVYTGNPGRSLKDKLPSGWPAYDLEGSHYLDFNLDPFVGRYLEREKKKLWSETIPSWVSDPSHPSAHTEL